MSGADDDYDPVGGMEDEGLNVCAAEESVLGGIDLTGGIDGDIDKRAKLYMYALGGWSCSVTGEVIVDEDEKILSIRDELTERLHVTDLRPYDQYTVESPLVIIWSDDSATGTGNECALSFNTQEGMMSFMNGLYKIEPPNFENIGKLNEKFAEACAKPPQMRITLVSGVLDEKWIASLVELVKEAEQMDSKDVRWTKLFQLFKHLVFLDPRQVCGRLMRDDLYKHVFRVFQHDPGIPPRRRHDHVAFFEKEVQRREVRGLIKDDGLYQVIDYAHRFAFLKDTALGRWLDDSQQMAMVQHLVDRYSYIFAQILGCNPNPGESGESGDAPKAIGDTGDAPKAAETNPKAKKAAETFERLMTALRDGDEGAFCLLGHALNLTQNQMLLRESLFNTLVPKKIFAALLGFLDGFAEPAGLEKVGSEIVVDAGRGSAFAHALDVLTAACQYNVEALKEELVRCERAFGLARKGSFKTLIDVLLGGQHVARGQAYEVLRTVLERTEREEDREYYDFEICRYFYERHFSRLVDALRAEHSSRIAKHADVKHAEAETAHKLQVVLDLLANCCAHKEEALPYFAKHDVIKAALPLLSVTQHKVALVGIVRLFRDMVRQDIVPMDSRVKMCRALKDFVELRGPVVKVKLNSDNLVTAAVNEMFDSFIERENCDLSKLQQGKEDPILEPERARLVAALLHDVSPYSKMLHLPVVQRLKRAQEAHEKQEERDQRLPLGPRDFHVGPMARFNRHPDEYEDYYPPSKRSRNV
jgi:hypothetical protein